MGLWRCKHMSAIYGKFRKLCHICHIASWSIHWSASAVVAVKWTDGQFISYDSVTKNCWVSNSFSLKLRRDWCRLHPLTTHATFSSAWSISFSLILLVSSQIFTLLQVGKMSSKITMSCSILMPSSWRHLGRYFWHHASLDLFVDFVPFPE